MAPPSEHFPADDIALVRPYFAAHERQRASVAPVPAPRVPEPRRAEPEEVQRGLDRAKAQAKVMYQQWREDPDGERSGEPAPQFSVVRAKPARYAEWDELTTVTRTWIGQQQRQEVSV